MRQIPGSSVKLFSGNQHSSKLQEVLSGVDKSINLKGSTTGFGLTSKGSTETQTFTVDGFPICRLELKTHYGSGGLVTALGSIPDVVVDRAYTKHDWSQSQHALDQAQAIRSKYKIRDELIKRKETKCLLIHDDKLVPVWEIEAEANNLRYRFIADATRVYDFQNMFFHVDGTAQVYDTNPVDGTLTTYTVRNLKPDSSGKVLVENDKFITLLDTSKYSYFADTSEPYEFVTSTSEESFKEISLFTNANRALEWLEGQGYSNFGNAAIRIIVHASFTNGDVNNALYQPGSDFSTIYVGDGDGSILRNLAVDYDVVAHELGHHVVYNSVTNIQDESLVIHEGLADFLTYAKTGNSCLGESICPESSTVCAVANKCLRTADNSYTLTSSDLPSEAHLRSQFISGYLWDLYSKDGISLDIVSRLTIKAINLLVSNSGYTHLVLGLMIADSNDYSGQYCSKIYDRAVARGMQENISSYSCSNISSIAQNTTSVTSVTGESNSSDSSGSSSSGKSMCGSIGNISKQEVSFFWFLLALPLVLTMRKRMIASNEKSRARTS